MLELLHIEAIQGYFVPTVITQGYFVPAVAIGDLELIETASFNAASEVKVVAIPWSNVKL
jgi:hypothetical protein